MNHILEIILSLILLVSSIVYLVFPERYAKYRFGKVKEHAVAIYRVFGILFLLASIGIFINLVL